jgi:hypothetical protein
MSQCLGAGLWRHRGKNLLSGETGSPQRLDAFSLRHRPHPFEFLPVGALMRRTNALNPLVNWSRHEREAITPPG